MSSRMSGRMVECFYVIELILDSNWFILDFYCKIVHLELLFFALQAFKFFYPRMN